MKLKVFLGGEGPNEMGGWYRELRWRERGNGAPMERGVLEALMLRFQPDGWEIVDAVPWKAIRKFRVGAYKHVDTQNILGMTLMAKERGCDVLVFSRDRDGDEERERAVETGIRQASNEIEDAPRIAGGVAIEEVESWIIALAGRSRSQQMGENQRKRVLEELDVGDKSTTDMVRIVEQADLKRLPEDARSLRSWKERVQSALGTEAPSTNS